MPKETVLQSIIAHVLGHKYYANIINTRGTGRCEISCFIFRSRQEAEAHRRSIGETMSFIFVETFSFRSHNDY